jgi:MFS-type transporter involved in bile tolerance (Atg22 family)
VHVRDDLAALPWIAIHSKALWVPILITIASTIATAATGANDVLTDLLFTYFVVFPAIGGVFIGGFLAPRASWLVGVIIGLVSALCYVLLGVTDNLPAKFAEPFTSNTSGATVSAFILSPIMGAFFAAGAAWYRRFLTLSSPNRNRRQSQTPKQRPGDGRTRGGNTSQKAGVKR